MTTWREYKTEETGLKKDVVERITRARKDGISTGVIARECGGSISIHVIYDMLEAKTIPLEMWEAVDKGLRKIGY